MTAFLGNLLLLIFLALAFFFLFPDLTQGAFTIFNGLGILPIVILFLILAALPRRRRRR